MKSQNGPTFTSTEPPGSAEAPNFLNERLLQPPPQPDEATQAAESGEEPRRELTEEEKAEQLGRHLEQLDPEDFGELQI